MTKRPPGSAARGTTSLNPKTPPSRPPAHLAWEAAAHNACVQVSAIQNFHRLFAALDHLPECSLHLIWRDLHRATLISWHSLSSTHTALVLSSHAVAMQCIHSVPHYDHPNLTEQTNAHATRLVLLQRPAYRVSEKHCRGRDPSW